MEAMSVFFSPSERTYHEEMIQTGISTIDVINSIARGPFSLLLVFPVMIYLLRYVTRLVWSSNRES